MSGNVTHNPYLIMQDEFLRLPGFAQNALAKMSEALNGVYPADVSKWQFAVPDLPSEKGDSSLIRNVMKWAGNSKNSLYYFQCTNESIDLNEVERLFINAKTHKLKNRAYARLNSQSECFYVGSSQSIAKRLSEHLGYGPQRTYALQLIHWAYPLNLELEFVCAKYPESTRCEIAQELEDALWEKRTPMFGRKGRK